MSAHLGKHHQFTGRIGHYADGRGHHDRNATGKQREAPRRCATVHIIIFHGY
jgi:hypothetical protein